MQFLAALQEKIDLKTKPLGALGKMEAIAFQIGKIQQNLSPTLSHPHILLFAADHGIAQEGVSAYPPEVTHQMVLNIVNGGAAVSVFSRESGIQVVTIDAGVNHDFSPTKGLIDAKIRKGTHSFSKQKAMTIDELNCCFEKSQTLVETVEKSGCNIIGFGEMGIGNTSAASMLMHYVCKIPLEECIGRGTGISDLQLSRKIEILTAARNFHGDIDNPLDVLATFGGFEIAQICGAMLASYRKNMILMVDGFIATSAFLIAHAIEPSIRENAIFCHNSNEIGHQKMLDFLDAHPLLHLDMRVGEGTGCALAYPIIKNAVAFLNEMASFDGAGISNK